MLQNIQTGLDTISLLGSYITSNDQFIFVSSNGYNMYNGMIMVFLKNIEKNENEITLQFHSEIHSPENFNSNFGVKTCATNKILVVSAISYNIYDGVIYIYELFKDMWIYRDKIYINANNKLNGFGANIQINNNELFISTFYNQLYHYKYDRNGNNKFSLNNTFNIFNSTYINLDVKMISDTMNNLFISNLTNTLTIINIDTMTNTYFTEDGSFNCFYGSELYIYRSNLFVSCSLYYPFYNIPEEINSQIYIYDLIYMPNNIIKTIKLREIIINKDNDPYFGTHLNVNNNDLIISGRNAIYYYNYKNKKMQFKNKYIVPYEFVNYDYKVLLIDDYFIAGNYGFNELQGAIFVGNIIDDDNPSYINTIPNNLSKSNLLNNIFAVVLIIIIGSAITVITTLFCYFFVTLLTPKKDDKKKKKEEEEFSPYKVYSYVGYVETDDVPIVYPMNYNPQYYYSSYYSPQYYNPHYYYNPQIEKEKEKENQLFTSPEQIVSYKDCDNDSIQQKEKVVSYRGYIYDSIQQRYKDKIKPILDEIKKE